MAFDWGGYNDKINDLMAKLGELDGIDRCVEYLNDLNSGKAVVWPGPGQKIVPGSPAGIATSVTLGVTYPFDMTVTITDGSVKENGQTSTTDTGGGTLNLLSRDLHNLMTIGAAETDPYVIRLNLTTSHISYADGDALAALSQRFTGPLVTPLKTLVDHDFGELEHDLGDWHGRAADTFADLVYYKVGTMASNQAYLADAIGTLLGGAKIITDLGQHTLMNIVDTALKVVDEQLKQRHDAHQPTSTSAFDLLALGAAVTGFLGVLTLPVPAVSGLFTAGSVGLTYASTQVPENSKEPGEQIKAESAQQLCSELDRVREKLLTAWDAHWDALNSKATTVQGDIDAILDHRLLFPPHIPLEDGVTKKTFHPGGV